MILHATNNVIIPMDFPWLKYKPHVFHTYKRNNSDAFLGLLAASLTEYIRHSIVVTARGFRAGRISWETWSEFEITILCKISNVARCIDF